MSTTTSEYERGDRVRVIGERGTYNVYRSELGPDGSILLYGGDTDPNGVQGFRAVMPNRVAADKRKRKGT